MVVVVVWGGYCSDAEEKSPRMLLMTSFFSCSLWHTMEHTVEPFACVQLSFLELFLVSFLTILCTNYTQFRIHLPGPTHACSGLSTVSAFKTLGKHCKHTDIYIYFLREGGGGCSETHLHHDKTDPVFLAICTQRAFPHDMNDVISACFTLDLLALSPV